MNAPKVRLTVAKISLLDAPPLVGELSEVSPLLPCKLTWRQKWLHVSPAHLVTTEVLPALGDKQWFKECLDRSSVKAACLSPNLGEDALKFWANQCEESRKQIYLRLPSLRLPQKRHQWEWLVKRILDLFVATTLLAILSPVLLLLALLIRLDSRGSIFFRQWRVGKRGKLFRILKFRSMVSEAEKLHHDVMGKQEGLHKRQDDPRITSIGRWMRKYSLDELPQLFNVLRGEMSLVGPRPWALYDAIRLPRNHQARLNALPGITGYWQVKGRSHCLDLETITQLDLDYLQHWSIRKDFKILLMTIPKVISGFGAY